MSRVMKMVLIVVSIIILSFGIGIITSYNSLVRKEFEIERTYAVIVNRLNERQATITQLLGTVEGLAAHEQAIIDSITDARSAYSQANQANDMEGMISADSAYVSGFGSLLVVIENYPQIATSDAFKDLMVTIVSIEGGLFVARKDYNDAIADYNMNLRLFPKSIVARMFSFTSTDAYWRLAPGAGDIPAIDFGVYANPQT